MKAKKCPGGGIGRRAGLKILFAARRVRVQFPSGALENQWFMKVLDRLERVGFFIWYNIGTTFGYRAFPTL